MIEIVNYEIEHTSINEEKINNIDNIINELQRRNPGCEIATDVIVIGSTGSEYLFPIKAGDRIIDTVRPNHQATGSIMRRMADIQTIVPMPPLIIVDDTDNLEKGMKELTLIGKFIPSMLLSTLKGEGSPIDLIAH